MIGPAKVLTIKQPWAELIMTGRKDVENRTWRTEYRGVLWIHSAKEPDLAAWLEHRGELGPGADSSGLIVGSVVLIDCVKGFDSEWAMPDHWHWVIRGARRLRTPVPARGKMGVWEFPGASLTGERDEPVSKRESTG